MGAGRSSRSSPGLAPFGPKVGAGNGVAHADGQMGSGWASVLKTNLSRLIRSTSSEKSRKKYLSVSPRKKLSILSRGSGLLGLCTLLMEV